MEAAEPGPDRIGRSPDGVAAGWGSKQSSSSSSSSRKDFLRKFVDSESLTASLEDWFSGMCKESNFRKPAFDVPFELTELQTFDYALEGVPFQQLMRMPNALQASTSDAVEATAHMAVEDFLHAGLKGLWDAFWGGPMPFSVACVHSTGTRFYPAEKAIASGKLDGVCATAVLLRGAGGDSHSQGKWDRIVELTLLRPDVQASQEQPHSVLGEALFFAVRALVSRSLSKSSSAVRSSNCVFVLLVDSQCGGVLKLQGEISRLDFRSYDAYERAAEWIRKHARISVSAIDRVWNKLGNSNWGDVGTLQLLLATFHSMAQFCGPPKRPPQELAAERSSRLHARRAERRLLDDDGRNAALRLQQGSGASPEIVEEEAAAAAAALSFDKGSVIYLEDSSDWRGGRAFQINGRLVDDAEAPIYSATLLDDDQPSKQLILYIGCSPARMDINLWYQVQRQTKILSLMKQRGLSSRHLPQAVASGRIVHPGQCAGESCGHPWCGTPVLAASPHGEAVSRAVRNGLFGPGDALRCCHDCLSAIAAASSAGIRHGGVSPESIVRVTSGAKRPFFVLAGWGRAVLEEKDRPPVNLYFSSTLALQEGKLCASSDAESLIYVLYFSCGGAFPDLDSVEGALEWREVSWSRRVIQQRLGEVSAVLKAFADYVDSLCGTPYPMDYDIWLRRLRRAMDADDDHGREIENSLS